MNQQYLTQARHQYYQYLEAIEIATTQTKSAGAD